MKTKYPTLRWNWGSVVANGVLLRKRIQLFHWPMACDPMIRDSTTTTPARSQPAYGPMTS